MFKIAAYGVRDNEKPYFQQLNTYGYELTLISDLLTHDNLATANHHDAVLLRANCQADATTLLQLKEWGIRYVFTRTVGFNHIDLQAAKENGQLVARVPSYSPHAVADLAFSMGLTLQRHVALAAYRSHQGNFKVMPDEFSGEIRHLTVGIIGTGHIGLAEAQNYKALGAKVLGYDPYPSEAARQVVSFVEQATLLQQADIVSLHVPYFPGKNDCFFNADLLALMKPTAILINTARAEIADTAAIIAALKADRLAAFGTDVIDHEGQFIGHDLSQQLPVDEPLQTLLDLYPRVLVTPHIGSYTEEALTDMIKISYDNFNDVLTTGHCANSLI